MINKKTTTFFSQLWRQFTGGGAASASKGEFFLLTMAAALLESCGGGGGGRAPSSAPPTEVALTATTTPPPEEGVSNRVKVADIAVTDSDGGRRNLELVGDDAHLFELNTAQTELYLRADSNLDYETNPRLDVIVRVQSAISVSDHFTVGVIDNTEEQLSVSGDFAFAVGTGREYQLTVADLSALDPRLGSSVAITWQVTDAPDNGYLVLRSDTATQVSSFEQADLEAGQVIYIHNGGGTADDFAAQAEYDTGDLHTTDAMTVSVEVVQDASPARLSYGVNNPWLSALLYGAGWAASPQSASVIVIEYAFQSGSMTDFTAPAWNDDEKNAVRSAMATWEAVCNIDFVEVGATEMPELEYWKFPASALDPGTLAYHEIPTAGVSEPFRGVFGYEATGWTTSGLMAGGIGFETIVHELGHALGLGHPHDDDRGGTFPGVEDGDDRDYGDHSLNQGIYTVMGYNSGWPERYPGHSYIDDHYGWSATPMAFDIAAVQALYGVNTASNIGDDIYVLPDSNVGDTYWSCIWDTGGDDTISAAGASQNCEIDLRTADLEGEGGGGYVSFLQSIIGGFTIANTVVIENAVGGNGHDMITGNGADNTLTGGGGADIFIFYNNFGSDTIVDFDVTTDKIKFADITEVTDRDAFIASSEEDGAGVVYNFGDDGENILRIEGVTLAELRANNFFEQGDDSDSLSRQYDAYAEAFSGEGELLLG